MAKWHDKDADLVRDVVTAFWCEKEVSPSLCGKYGVLNIDVKTEKDFYSPDVKKSRKEIVAFQKKAHYSIIDYLHDTVDKRDANGKFYQEYIVVATDKVFADKEPVPFGFYKGLYDAVKILEAIEKEMNDTTSDRYAATRYFEYLLASRYSDVLEEASLHGKKGQAQAVQAMGDIVEIGKASNDEVDELIRKVKNHE